MIGYCDRARYDSRRGPQRDRIRCGIGIAQRDRAGCAQRIGISSNKRARADRRPACVSVSRAERQSAGAGLDDSTVGNDICKRKSLASTHRKCACDTIEIHIKILECDGTSDRDRLVRRWVYTDISVQGDGLVCNSATSQRKGLVADVVECQPSGKIGVGGKRDRLRPSQGQRGIPQAVNVTGSPVGGIIIIPRPCGGLVETGGCRLRVTQRSPHGREGEVFEEAFCGMS